MSRAERIGCRADARRVQTEFLQFIRDDAGMERELRAIPSRSYNLKAIAGYEIGPDAGISLLRATQAVEAGRIFVNFIGKIVARPEREP